MTAPPPVDLGPTLGVGYIGVGLCSMRVTASISKVYNRTDTDVNVIAVPATAKPLKGKYLSHLRYVVAAGTGPDGLSRTIQTTLTTRMFNSLLSNVCVLS